MDARACRIFFLGAALAIGLGRCGSDDGGDGGNRQPAWGAAKRVGGEAGERSSEPVVAFDSNGVATAVWSQALIPPDQHTRTFTWVAGSHYTPGRGWTGMDVLDNPMPQMYLTAPQLGVTPDGSALVISMLHNGFFFPFDLYTDSFAEAAGWGEPAALENQVFSAPEYRIAVAPSGRAAVIRSNHDTAISYAFGPGAGWTGPVTVHQDLIISSSPRIAVDATGTFVAVWPAVLQPSLQTVVYAGHSDDGLTWSGIEPISLAASVSAAWNPNVAVNGSGLAVAIWLQDEPQERRSIWAAVYNPGSGWEPALQVASAQPNPREPQVIVDSNSVATAMWTQELDLHQELWTARLDGPIWSQSQLLSAGNGERLFSPPALGVDVQRNVMAVWAQPSGQLAEVWAIRATGGVTWSTPVRLGPTDRTRSAFTPQMAIDGMGRALALWSEGTIRQSEIWASRFE